jgi:hypothetical protein
VRRRNAPITIMKTGRMAVMEARMGTWGRHDMVLGMHLRKSLIKKILRSIE